MITTHSFPVEAAAQIGVEGAIMLSHIAYWIRKNEANEKHFYDGTTWTYNSIKAFAKMFPYWSARQIERILNKLCDDGYICKGNYNETAYDRTLWYSLTEKGKCICGFGDFDFTKRGNGNTQTVKSLIYSDINTNINQEEKENIKESFFEEQETAHSDIQTPKPNLFSSPNKEALKKAPTLNCSGDTPVQIKPPTKEDDDDFMTFFNASPVQSRFQTALETWHQKRIKGRLPPIDKILEALEEQKLYRYTDPKYIPSPAKWLEEEEWRYVIDAKTKARINKILHEKRLDELEEMYRGDATNEEIEAFARKYNLMPDVFPQVGNEEGKNEFE